MEGITEIQPNTLIARVPVGIPPKLQETILRGEPAPQETIKRLTTEQFKTLQTIRNIVVRLYPQAQVYLFGRAARVEIFDIEEEINDLDVLLTGITADQLVSEGFIGALSCNFQVEVAGTDVRFLRLCDMEGQHVADIDVVDIPSNSSLEELIYAMQIFASTVAVFKVQDQCLVPTSIFFEPKDVPGPIVVTAPRASGAAKRRQVSTIIRALAEPARTPSSIFTFNLEQLNKFRLLWLSFRSKEINPDKIAAIDKTVKQRLEEAFYDASQIPGGQETLFLALCHTGAFHALFPVAWACCSHQLFSSKDGQSIYDLLRENGFSLENIRLAIELTLIPQASQNISAIVDVDPELDSTWQLSYAQNIRILQALAGTVVLTQGEHHFTAEEIVFQPAPDLQTLQNSGKAIDRARALWLRLGVPYLQALVLVNLYHEEKLLRAGYEAAGLSPLTSYYDRVGIVFERVNTHLLRMLASDQLPKIFSIAQQIVTTEVMSQFKILCSFLAIHLKYIEGYCKEDVTKIMKEIAQLIIDRPDLF